MVIINKKRIQIIMACIFISLFAFSIQMSQTQNNTQRTNSSNNLVETTSTPVSGKTIVISLFKIILYLLFALISWNLCLVSDFKASMWYNEGV